MVKLMHVYWLTNLCLSLCLALPQFLNNHVLDSITVFYFTLSFFSCVCVRMHCRICRRATRSIMSSIESSNFLISNKHHLELMSFQLSWMWEQLISFAILIKVHYWCLQCPSNAAAICVCAIELYVCKHTCMFVDVCLY